jgi:hypothetical protein
MKRLRPILIAWGVVFGIALGFGLCRKYGARAREGSSVALFGETRTKDVSPHLTRADATAVFGAVTLDLREAQIDDEATVDALALFGGVEVLVPKRWRLSLSGRPIFGGFDDRTRSEPVPPPDAPILKVNGLAVFGGVVVANEPAEVSRRSSRSESRTTS